MNISSVSIAVFDKRANDYQEKYMDVSLYAETLDAFCDSFKKTDVSILEVGCGPGNITRYLLDQLSGATIFGIDLAPNMIALAKKNNPEASFEVMDCRDISKINQSFDGIMSGFCLPYLSKEEAMKFIADCSLLLKKDGILYLSTMEGDYDKSGFTISRHGDSFHTYFHQFDYIEKILLEKEFSICQISRKTYDSSRGTATTDLIILAKKS